MNSSGRGDAPRLRELRWAPGESHSQRALVALPPNPSAYADGSYQVLRIDLDSSVASAEQFRAVISLEKGGGVLGPIDVPCEIEIPGATRIDVAPTLPVTAPTAITLRVLPQPVRVGRNWAACSHVVALGARLSLNPYLRAVGLVPDVAGTCRFRWVDRAGAYLSGDLVDAHDRPALAVAAELTGAGGPAVLMTYY